MNNDQRVKLRENIQSKIKEIKENIASYKKLAKPVSPDNAIGRLTRMEALNSKSVNEAALSKAKTTLKMLERALSKIDDSDFGFCIECEKPIPFARLAILPETNLCVQCAEHMNG